jgi:predicted site-specific integrase-resolvase
LVLARGRSPARLEVNFKTVRRYVRAGSVDVLLAGGGRASVLEPT